MNGCEAIFRRRTCRTAGRKKPPLSPKPSFRPSVCNRLDSRNTGGILLFAKIPSRKQGPLAVIRDRVIRKTYIMVVHGQVMGGRGD